MSVERHADKLIEVYLNWLLSTDTAAGWHQPSMLQSMIEFKGCLPPPSGNDQADLKMIREIEHLRKPHALLAEAREVMERIKPKYRVALLLRCRYQGTYEASTGKLWTAARIAGQMGLTVDQYREQAKYGRKRLINLVGMQADPAARKAA